MNRMLSVDRFEEMMQEINDFLTIVLSMRISFVTMYMYIYNVSLLCNIYSSL